MSRRLLVGSLLLLAALPAAARPPQIQVEKATIGWNELKRLIEADGDAAPLSLAPTPPPHSYATSAEIEGQVEGGRAALQIVIDLEVLADRWVLVPVLPPSLAVASAQVDAPSGQRGLLVREPGGVVIAASGAGHYRVSINAEGNLEHAAHGIRLRLPMPGLTGGHAHIIVPPGERPTGLTPWKRSTLPGDRTEAEAALGAEGLDLVLADEDAPTEASGSLDGLTALTVVSLGGSAVTRLTFHATPSEGGGLSLTLPHGARLWKAFIDDKALEAGRLAVGDQVQLPIKHPSQIELAYTFSLPPMGLRGRYRVELPRWQVPVRDSSWQLWLPDGLHYSETQAALGPLPRCMVELPAARTPLTSQGQCFSFARSVLDPGAAYVEGSYVQPL